MKINLICANIFVQFILPALIIAGIAGILAFFLAFLGNKLAVERDARIDDVKRHLSGANCGGCGYAGCDAFAEAVVKGEAPANGCTPGGAKAAKVSASVMLY